MKKIVLILCVIVLISCNKEKPCQIDERFSDIKMEIKFDSLFQFPQDSLYRFFKLTIFHNDSVYPFTFTDDYIQMKIPSIEALNDTFFLNWYNIPDIDTLILNYKLLTGEENPCDNFEYCHAWFNGVYYKEPDAIRTFYFTKK